MVTCHKSETPPPQKKKKKKKKKQKKNNPKPRLFGLLRCNLLYFESRNGILITTEKISSVKKYGCFRYNNVSSYLERVPRFKMARTVGIYGHILEIVKYLREKVVFLLYFFWLVIFFELCADGVLLIGSGCIFWICAFY